MQNLDRPPPPSEVALRRLTIALIVLAGLALHISVKVGAAFPTGDDRAYGHLADYIRAGQWNEFWGKVNLAAVQQGRFFEYLIEPIRVLRFLVGPEPLQGIFSAIVHVGAIAALAGIVHRLTRRESLSLLFFASAMLAVPLYGNFHAALNDPVHWMLPWIFLWGAFRMLDRFRAEERRSRRAGWFAAYHSLLFLAICHWELVAILGAYLCAADSLLHSRHSRTDPSREARNRALRREVSTHAPAFLLYGVCYLAFLNLAGPDSRTSGHIDSLNLDLAAIGFTSFAYFYRATVLNMGQFYLASQSFRIGLFALVSFASLAIFTLTVTTASRASRHEAGRNLGLPGRPAFLTALGGLLFGLTAILPYIFSERYQRPFDLGIYTPTLFVSLGLTLSLCALALHAISVAKRSAAVLTIVVLSFAGLATTATLAAREVSKHGRQTSVLWYLHERATSEVAPLLIEEGDFLYAPQILARYHRYYEGAIAFEDSFRLYPNAPTLEGALNRTEAARIASSSGNGIVCILALDDNDLARARLVFARTKRFVPGVDGPVPVAAESILLLHTEHEHARITGHPPGGARIEAKTERLGPGLFRARFSEPVLLESVIAR